MATSTIINYGEMSSGNRKSGLTSAGQTPVYLDPENIRKAEYTVYLHTVSKRNFMQPNGIYRNIRIPKCPDDKRSICFMKIQHPVQIPHLNPDDVNGPPALKIENAIRVALGICNPNYAGTDFSVQDKEIDPSMVLSSGECNLNRQGIFASMNEEPTEEELRKAEARREKYYRFLIQEADGLERSNPRELQSILNQDHHLAADYFGLDANWHRSPTAKMECGNCGQKIPRNAAFHYDNGRLCVLDWERAWLAGAVKKEDVPEPKRWWNEAPQDELSGMSRDELKALAAERNIDVDLRWSAEKIASAIREKR